MQIEIDTKILETIFAHATTAARLARYIDDAIIVDGVIVDGVIVIDELAKSIREINRMVAALLGKPGDTQPGEATQDDEPEFNVANSVDGLRQLVARADALANAAEGLFEQVIRVKDEADGRQFERVAHLVGATAEAVRTAAVAGDGLARRLSTLRLEVCRRILR